ncbi:MAG: asparagine synthetase B, partial [Candidatus Omnitrophica bacterium]|nr:asparagine synthetase B [Candidatus Omnitrophota bacterium]
MCGIVGAYFSHPRESFPILKMTSALRHRGPDDEGYVLIDPVNGVYDQRRGPDTRQELRLPSIEASWTRPTQIVFGHRRLAVIDLSVNAHQPMPDREGRFWIIGNGEIYNYIELRKELASEGAVFCSGSDTEVILEAYKKWGEDCLHHFNGMWAFALWDSDHRTLFAARDRFGVKPFYYAQSGGDFFFASEIKALLEVPGMSRKIEEESVFDFLAFSQL